jgi:itaconyl-CoA hydratase
MSDARTGDGRRPPAEDGGHMGEANRPAPKQWRGRFFEDFEVGDLFRGRLGRTITETDNAWFTMLTLNTNQMHFNEPYAARTRFRRQLVNSTLTLALITGMSVPDTSENATANLSWTDIKLSAPVFVGDTLWVESEVLETRPSSSQPTVGIVSVRSRGINQRGEVVIEFRRTFMVYCRSAPEAAMLFPEPTTDWTV